MNARLILRSLLCCLACVSHSAFAEENGRAEVNAQRPKFRNSDDVRIVSDSGATDTQSQSQPLGLLRGNNFALRLIPTALPPVIDGALDDSCWRGAPEISDFTQVEPHEGAKPSERTEVRVLYDENNLYIAIRCHQREAHLVRGTQMQPDANLDSDDSIALIFDTFGRKRSGYLFRTNPAGAKQEGLISANGSVNTNWDTLWHSRSRLNAAGWSAEMAIPFHSLSFDPTSTVWGFNVERVIRDKQETVRWAFPFRNKSISSLADVGRLQGLSGLRQGLGLEVKPSLTARYLHDRFGRGHDDFDFRPSLDVFYHITSSMTAALTLNTDFGETDVDARQVNLTRFPLFFPEKRSFFLEDANLFGFSTYNGPRAFYSRRIGLSPGGEPLDILAGVKLSGRVGNLELGLLDVQVDEFANIDSTNLAVARLSYRIFEESSIGGIFTHGSPTGTGDNWVVGGDLNYRNSHVVGNNLMTAQTWFLKSDDVRRDGNQLAFGGSFAYPNEPFWLEAGVSQIGEDFNPGLGFVSRRGIRDYSAYTRYRWRPEGYIRTVDLEFSPRVVTNLNDEIETEYWTAPSLNILNQRGDSLAAGFVSEREVLADSFEIQPGVVIETGDYRFQRGYVVLSSTTARPLSVYGSLDAGEFYDGSSERYSAGMEWRVSPFIFVSAQSSLEAVDLPGGNFEVVVSSLRLNLTFNPDLSWNTLLQHDNVSDDLGVFSRIRWTFSPGNDVYLVFKLGFDAENLRFRSTSSEIISKIGMTFRF